MKVIAEYQHTPLLPAGAEGGAGVEFADDWPPTDSETAGSRAAAAHDEATSQSHTPLPGFRSPGSHRAGSGPRPHRGWRDHPPEPGTGTGTGTGAGLRAGGWKPGGLRRRRSLPLWGWALGVVLLLGAGGALGAVLHGSGGRLGPLTPPPTAACVASSDGQPRLCVSQPYGDGDTVFVVHGIGFTPGTTITVALAGVGVSPERPVADESGVFNYAVDQGHYFFRGPIPTGTYDAVATAPGQHSASTTFRVYPAGKVPPEPALPGAPPSAPPGAPQ